MKPESLTIAYFINQYPMVSHSFIRREIAAVEAQGFVVKRFVLRTKIADLVDVRDQEEYKKTRYLLEQSYFVFLKAALLQLFWNPVRLTKAFCLAITMGRRSDRGLLRHLFYLAEACLLTRWLVVSNIQHVHAHFGTNSTTVVMLAHLLGGPAYSFTVHGSELDNPEHISLGEKVRQAAFVVAISSYTRSQLYRLVDYKYWDKVKVIRCGLETEFHQGNIPPISNSSKLIFVGRLCNGKGLVLLIHAAAKLMEEGVEFQLVLAGDGPLRKDLEKLINQHGLESYMNITGYISSDRVRDELLSARALILPSFSEGLPVVIMEAMALQRPALSTYIGGIPELVYPGENGWLVPAGSVEDLKDAMCQLLKMSEQELNILGKNARQLVLKRHDVDTEAGKLTKLFRHVMACKEI